MSDVLKIVWNVFFKGPEGFKEHFQVEGTDPASAMKGRSEVLTDLQAIGATPEFPAKPAASQAAPRPAGTGNYPAAQPMPYPSQMERAAREAFPGAQVQQECPRGCGPMRYVKGTAETGKLSRNNKPYPSFWSCSVCKENVNV